MQRVPFFLSTRSAENENRSQLRRHGTARGRYPTQPTPTLRTPPGGARKASRTRIISEQKFSVRANGRRKRPNAANSRRPKLKGTGIWDKIASVRCQSLPRVLYFLRGENRPQCTLNIAAFVMTMFGIFNAGSTIVTTDKIGIKSKNIQTVEDVDPSLANDIKDLQ